MTYIMLLKLCLFKATLLHSDNHNRVQLKIQDGKPSTDYIDASFIKVNYIIYYM